MKIDTLELQTRAILSEEAMQILRSKDHNTYHKEAGDYECYKYDIEGAPCEVVVQYTVQNQKLRIHISSLPKLITGSSVISLNDSHRDQVYLTIQKILEGIKIEADPIPEWLVRQMHTYHDFQVGNQVQDYISVFSKVQLPRYQTIMYAGESVSFKCDYMEHQVYDKQKKVLKEHGVTKEEVERCKGILRYEVRYRTANLGNADYRKFGEVCTDEVTGSMISKYFNTLPMSNLTISSANEVQKKLTALYGGAAAIHMMGFIDAYGRNALDDVYSDTKGRYLRKLRKAGVSPILENLTLPPLILPFTDQQTITSVKEIAPKRLTEYRRLPCKRETAQRDKTYLAKNTDSE